MCETQESSKVFREIFGKDTLTNVDPPDEVECYICRVQPKDCKSIITHLNFLPLVSSDDKIYAKVVKEHGTYPWPLLGHLRRVRRSKLPGSHVGGSNDTEKVECEEPTKKRKVESSSDSKLALEVLIGSVIQVDDILQKDSRDESRNRLEKLFNAYSLRPIKCFLPGRPAKNQKELNLWKAKDGGNGWWPSLFFEEQTDEFKQRMLHIDPTEEQMMLKGMHACLDDANMYRVDDDDDERLGQFDGAVVMCPTTGTVVSSSFAEFKTKTSQGTKKENEKSKSLLLENPLNTSVSLAIQGVSRIEREAAMGNGILSSAFKQGQYLLTGYDMYLTKEPGAFESMACLHSRIRRIIFGVRNVKDGGLVSLELHCLPGTNHRFRVFECIHPDILNKCQDLYK